MSSTVKPVYMKLRELIAAAIMDGTYAEGAMLPSVRVLAAQEGANPLTVAKAYQQFQVDGLVAVQRGVGMYVVRGASERLRAAERTRFLTAEWPGVRARIERLGLDVTDLLARV
ncbi:GntR family transcriptional regulator [Qipengyuania sediminis]|uniref:GntR family transcriptional regulator n=1 Tax=Qipengyuania sediminis TaxID=1532023 RepID=UPI00105A06A2|nr:GntR family transcriptional regulator [Qipengyuania sediminis]